MFRLLPLQDIAPTHARLHESDTCLMWRDESLSTWKKVSWLEANGKVQSVAEGLIRLGIESGDRVGVFSENFAEFLYTDLALFSIRAVEVPLYATLSSEQVQFVAKDSGFKVLFVGQQLQYDVAYPVSQELGFRIITLSKGVIFKEEDRESLTFEELNHYTVADTQSVLAKEVEKRRKETKPSDLALILYTSGTTGESKGVMLSHQNILVQIHHHMRMKGIKAQRVSFNFLPLTHIFEKMWCLLCLECDIVIAVNSDPKQVTKTLPEVRPHYMCNVPRFWEKVYFGVKEKIGEVKPSYSRIMQDCIEVARKVWIEYKAQGKPVPTGLALKYAFYDKTLLSLLRKKVGLDRGVLYPASGAALAKDIHGFLLSIGIPIVYGYGMTETTATVSYQMPNETKLGSVGRVVNGVEIALDETQGGELLVKGESVTEGYYKREEENKKSITKDGFFRTGDLMYIDKDRYLYFKERSKDLFKTANGKYVAPQAIENLILSEGTVEQAMVIADRRNFVSALIYPNWDRVRKILISQEYTQLVNEAPSQLRMRPEVLDLLLEHIQDALQGLAGYEQVKKIYILPEPFSIDNGQLTPSLKTKRSVIMNLYKSEIDSLYGYSID